MKPVFFVPIKLQSQRLPNKMLLKLGNKLLCQYIFDVLIEVKKKIDIDIYCFCSDEKIKHYLPQEVLFLKRDEKLDRNETKGLEIYKSFCNLVKVDIYGLVHATSPFIKAESIIKGLENVINNSNDSSFSVSKIQTFCWYDNKILNYSLDNVVRTQDIKPVYWETSAFYIFKSEILNKLNRRIGKNPYLVETDRIESIDIDEKEDFILAEKIVK
jgi:CMP-N-acetylneuraminic acid synthetase